MIRLTSFLDYGFSVFPSDALSQHLPYYLGFCYLGCGISPHGWSSKAQPLLLTLDEGYLLTAAPPDLEHGVALLGPPVPAATAPWTWDCSSSVNSQMFKLVLEKAEEPEIKLPTSAGSWISKRVPEKPLFLLN